MNFQMSTWETNQRPTATFWDFKVGKVCSVIRTINLLNKLIDFFYLLKWDVCIEKLGSSKF